MEKKEILAVKNGLTIYSTKDNFYPMVEKDGILYDFQNGLKSEDGKEVLPYSLWQAANELRTMALKRWQINRQNDNKHEPAQTIPQPEPIKVEVEKVEETAKQKVCAQTARKTALSALETLLAESVQQINTEEILENLKPQIDEYVKQTYGNLPKIVHVKTPNGETRKVKGLTHEKFEEVLQVVSARENVFLTGPAGAGKNHICKQVADALGLDFYFSNAVTQEFKLTGFIDGYGKYHTTEFRQAFENGGLFMLDEMDASMPEVLVALNSALANGYFNFPDVGKIYAHENFYCVAAGNTFGTGADAEYTGRFQLDAASLNRFFLIPIDYDTNIEKTLANNDMEIVNFVHDFRDALRVTKIPHVVSYRNISRLYKLKDILDTVELVRGSVCGALTKEDLRYIAKNLKGASQYHKAVAKLAE